MINKDSIVTAYDEHLTLVEWLQKVEKALDNAVLTNLGIAKLSDKDNVATYQVTATFADNTAIASDSFTLPSTDIVTAFNSLKTLVNGFDSRIATNRENVNSILDIIDIAGEKIKADVLKNSINGDDDIIVEIDNDEENEKLGIHLSPELQAKLARVLLTPSSAPTTRKVVTIDTNGAQDNVDPTELTTLMGNIVDSQGRKRFIEGNMSSPGGKALPESITITYGKWSLSGSHFMMVVCGTIAKNVINTTNFAYFTEYLPKWINNKIHPLHGQGQLIGSANMYIFDSADTVNPNYRELTVIPVVKWSELGFYAYSNFKTFDYDGTFRVQFDLLIDSD